VGDVAAQILEVLQEVSGSGEVRRNPDLPLYRSGLLDSLGTVSLMAAFAERFGLEISPAEFDAELWATPALLVADIQRRLGGA
jgi:D-alanine--poly(phosphoribitol) ligase subunit 2